MTPDPDRQKVEQIVAEPRIQDRVKVAKIIANAMGDNFADAFANKTRWIAKRGMSGGRFRDVNEPFQSDYLAAADAAFAAVLSLIQENGK